MYRILFVPSFSFVAKVEKGESLSAAMKVC